MTTPSGRLSRRRLGARPVTGPVAVAVTGTVAVTATVAVAVTGTVAVTATVAGTVAVTATVAGTVAVTVAGTVAVTATVAVTHRGWPCEGASAAALSRLADARHGRCGDWLGATASSSGAAHGHHVPSAAGWRGLASCACSRTAPRHAPERRCLIDRPPRSCAVFDREHRCRACHGACASFALRGSRPRQPAAPGGVQ
jgi:hypothetical protein